MMRAGASASTTPMSATSLAPSARTRTRTSRSPTPRAPRGATSPTRRCGQRAALLRGLRAGPTGSRPAAELLDGVVDSCVEPAAAIAVRLGLDPEVAVPPARLGVAVTRGLLLDLVATGDREAADAASEQWIALNEPLFEGSPYASICVSSARDVRHIALRAHRGRTHRLADGDDGCAYCGRAVRSAPGSSRS